MPFDQPAYSQPQLTEQEIINVKGARARKTPQVQPGCLPVELRDSFDLIELTFTQEEAQREAARCVQCTTFCDKCVEVCPNRANYTFAMAPVDWRLPVLAPCDCGLSVAGMEAFSISQNRQILHVDDFCNECDDCQTFCVHHGKPYADKPRLFIDVESFAAEESNAFHIAGNTIRRREEGRESSLTLENGTLTYEDALVRVSLTRDWQVKEMAAKEAFEGSLSLRSAAEMAVLYDGIMDSLPFLVEV